eukprot:9997291-Lingulodinium_polyedra.AAC.1
MYGSQRDPPFYRAGRGPWTQYNPVVNAHCKLLDARQAWRKRDTYPSAVVLATEITPLRPGGRGGLQLLPARAGTAR